MEYSSRAYILLSVCVLFLLNFHGNLALLTADEIFPNSQSPLLCSSALILPPSFISVSFEASHFACTDNSILPLNHLQVAIICLLWFSFSQLQVDYNSCCRFQDRNVFHTSY